MPLLHVRNNHGAVPVLTFPRYATSIPGFQTSCTVGGVHNNSSSHLYEQPFLFLFYVVLTEPINEHLLISLLMRLWNLSHRRPAKAQASLRIREVLSEHSLFTHINYRSRRRVRPKIRHVASQDDCPCAFEE